MVHFQRWKIRLWGADNSGWHTYCRPMRWYRIEHDAPSTDYSPFADLYIPQNRGPGTDEDPSAYLGMPIPALLASASQSYLVQDRHVILDDGSFPNDKSRGMIQENPRTDPGSGMNVDREDFGDPALQKQCQGLPALLPGIMGHAVRLNCVKTLKVQQRNRVFASACRSR